MNNKKMNYGWFIVAYGVLTMLFLHYGTVGSQAIFMNPITADLAVTKTKLTMASTYTTVVSFFVTPWAGKLMNRKSLRILLFIGIMGTSLSMVAQSFITSVYQYYAVMLIRTPFSTLCMMIPFATLTARWFTKKERSFATSIVFVGISLGGVLLSNPLASLIESIGWRATYRYYGLLALILLAPLTLLIVRDYPDNYEEILASEGKREAGEKIDFISLFKNPQFILLMIGTSCISFIGGSLYHMSTFVQSIGYSAAVGATVISAYNLVCMFSKMIMGKLFDTCGMKAGVLYGGIGYIGAFFFMILALIKSSMVLLVLIALFYGIGNTCQSMTATSMVAGVFGVKHYSEVYTKLSAVTMAISAICIPAVSALYESTGSYLTCWVLCLVLSVVSLLFLMKAASDKR